MKNVAVNLKKLTNDFYNQIPIEFDTTRRYQWVGWKNIVEYVNEKGAKSPKSILDIACGNGRFVETAKEFAEEGFYYLGIDNNVNLLQYATEKYANDQIEFKNIDIYNDWCIDKKFDCIVAMGITHHLVDADSRVGFFKKIYNALSENGFAVVTFWDFLSHPSLIKKIVNVNDEHLNLFKDLGENDYILNWKKGKISYRYAHYYKEAEIKEIFESANLQVLKQYSADGHNGKSNLYYILGKK
jgi:SAM-dependent methyltransferase